MRCLVLLAMVLSGCASLPADPTKMSAEQLKEWAKDRNANVSCAVINSPYGRGVMTYVTLDRGIVVDGSVTVNDQCVVTITNTRPQAVKTVNPANCYQSGSALVCESK